MELLSGRVSHDLKAYVDLMMDHTFLGECSDSSLLCQHMPSICWRLLFGLKHSAGSWLCQIHCRVFEQPLCSTMAACQQHRSAKCI